MEHEDEDGGGRKGKVQFTKERIASPTFPHQVHSPRQGARVGEGPRIHASSLGTGEAKWWFEPSVGQDGKYGKW